MNHAMARPPAAPQDSQPTPRQPSIAANQPLSGLAGTVPGIGSVASLTSPRSDWSSADGGFHKSGHHRLSRSTRASPRCGYRLGNPAPHLHTVTPRPPVFGHASR